MLGQEKLCHIRDAEGKSCVYAKAVGTVLNEYFASMFTKERKDTDLLVQEGHCEILGWIIIDNMFSHSGILQS